MNPESTMIYPQRVRTNVEYVPLKGGGEQPVVGLEIDEIITLLLTKEDAHRFITQIQLGIQQLGIQLLKDERSQGGQRKTHHE
jgi:hypothetical protein